MHVARSSVDLWMDLQRVRGNYDTNFPHTKLINNKYTNNNHPMVIYLSTIISSYFSPSRSKRTSNADYERTSPTDGEKWAAILSFGINKLPPDTNSAALTHPCGAATATLHFLGPSAINIGYCELRNNSFPESKVPRDCQSNTLRVFLRRTHYQYR